MAAAKGNKYWKLRINPGRKNKLTPLRLRNEAAAFMEDVVSNPFIIKKQVMHQGAMEVLVEEKPRLMTIGKLCRYLGISLTTFHEYAKQEAFADIIGDIKGIMYDYKLDGAAAGEFNANIIARELGLGERTVVELVEPPTADERKARLLELAEKCL